MIPADAFQLTPETEVERRVTEDPDWVAGLWYGKPRAGHPEGAVGYHVPHVLLNVDRVALDEEDRGRLRVVALTHDNFKYAVDRSLPRSGTNHHGAIAARFAERYVEDREVVEVIELHDEAFACWKKGNSRDKWNRAEERALRLVERLGASLPFYLRFFEADNGTPGKRPDALLWFRALVESTGGSS